MHNVDAQPYYSIGLSTRRAVKLPASAGREVKNHTGNSSTTTTTDTLHSSSALFNKATDTVMSRTIRLDEAPDAYRGDLTCISFITDVDREYVGGNGTPNVSYIFFEDGQRAGTLRTWYGNGGDGKKASQELEPAEGVEVQYVDWENFT